MALPLGLGIIVVIVIISGPFNTSGEGGVELGAPA
jgi:hypothetical protein